MKIKDIYIELLEYAIDNPIEQPVKFELLKPKHNYACREFFVRSVGIAAGGRYEWSCVPECSLNGSSAVIIASDGYVTAEPEEEEE